MAIFALAVATSYLIYNNKNYLITLIPGIFYTFIVFAFIINVKGLGFGQDFKIAYPIAAILAIAYAVFVVKVSKKNRRRIEAIKLD